MNKNGEKFIAKGVIIGLLGIGVASIYWSYSKPVVESKKSIVVSTNNSQSKEDDKPLQIIKKDKVDVIGLNKVLGITSDNEVIAQIGSDRKDIEEKYKKYGDNMSVPEEMKFFKEISGQTYKLNLSTSEKTPFTIEKQSFNNLDFQRNISPDGTKFLYFPRSKDLINPSIEEYYIYDIKNNSKKKVFAKGECLNFTWSKDSKYVIGLNIKKQNLLIYDIEKDSVKTININNKINNKKIDVGLLLVSEDGKNVYCLGRHKEEEKGETLSQQGVYKLNVDNGKLELVVDFPDKFKEDDIKSLAPYGEFDVIDGGKKIIFSGILNGEHGLYIYDVDTKKYTNLGEAKERPESFLVSPDEGKVIYTIFNKDKECWNVYAAKIKDDKLVNKILLRDNIKNLVHPLKNSSRRSAWWSEDSKKVLIYEEDQFKLGELNFAQKGIVNRIYLK